MVIETGARSGPRLLLSRGPKSGAPAEKKSPAGRSSAGSEVGGGDRDRRVVRSSLAPIARNVLRRHFLHTIDNASRRSQKILFLLSLVLIQEWK